MKDIVFPRNNEKEFIQMATRLGYNKLIFVYDKDVADIKSEKIKIEKAVLVKPNKIGKVKGTVIVENSDKLRLTIENKKTDIIFNLENQRKDFMHHRNSGLNQVLAKLAYKNKIKIGVSLSNVLKAENMLRSQLLGRIMQNVRICRKYKVDMLLASFAHDPYEMRAPKDIMSLGVCLGMHPSDAKKALD
jgi:ribonuclease P/MRP protein subunit RPP1